MTTTRRSLSLKDLEEDVDTAGSAVLAGAVEGNKRRRRQLALTDVFPEEKKEVPFGNGSKLNIAGFQTDIPLSTGTSQFLAGAGKRFVDVGRRAKQVMRVPGAQQEIDEARSIDAPLMGTVPGMLGYTLPDVIATAPLGGAGGVRGAAGVGALSAALNPTTTGENELTNLSTGLLGGIVGHGVGAAASNLGGRALSSAPALIPDKVRALAARRGINLPTPRYADPEACRLYELAKANKVPVTIGDIDPLSGWHRTENVLENLPSGRVLFLKEQQGATKDVVNKLRTDFDASPKGAEISEGVKRQHAAVGKEASKLFKVVRDIADNDPNISPITPTGTYQQAQEVLKANPALFDEFKNKPFVRKVLGLERDTGPQPGMIIDPKTNKPFQYDQKLSFEDAQYIRKQLGAWQAKLDRQLQRGTLPSGVTGEDVGNAKRLYGAFERDLDAWGSAPENAAVSSAWKDARTYFNNNVMPYRDPTRLDSKSRLIRDIVNDDVDVATIPAKLFSKDETNLVSDIMSLSDAGGKQAVKSSLLDRMTRDATHPDIPGLDSAALLKMTNKHTNAGESAFNAGEITRIQNTRDLARMGARSGDLGKGGEGAGERLPAYLMGGTGMVGVGGTTYMALNALDRDTLSPTDRMLLALGVAPLAALIGARAGNKYTSSALGKTLHFADPVLSGPLGTLQKYGQGAIRGVGAPLAEEYVDYPLGHREGP